MCISVVWTLIVLLSTPMTPVDARLLPDEIISVSCPVSKTCYMLDRAGNLLFTTEAGRSISMRARHADLGLKKIRFSGLLTGWGLDQAGGLWCTRDGGISFAPALDSTSGPIVDITQDEGKKDGIWTATRDGLIRFINQKAEVEIQHKVSMTLRSISIFLSNFVLLTGNGFLYVSLDDGINWKTIKLPKNGIERLSDGKPDGRLLAFDRYGQAVLIDSQLGSLETIFDDSGETWLDAASFEENWILAGRRGRLAFLYATHDRQIDLIDLNQTYPDLVTYAAQPDGRCLAAFRNGWIWRSDDAGLRWKSLGQPLPAPVKKIAFSDASHGYALVGTNTIYKTQSGGATWSKAGKWPQMILNDIFFINRDLGWAVGENGCMIRTMDGGSTWTLDRIHLRSSLQVVRFVDINIGWVLGDRQLIFKTLDGGRTWVKQQIDKGKFYDLHITKSGFGLLVGNEGTILATENWGIKWEEQHSPIPGDLRTIAFLDEQHMLIGGDGGLALQSNDGGESWTKIDLNTKVDIYSVVCLAKFARCLIGGQNGLMLGGEPFALVP